MDIIKLPITESSYFITECYHNLRLSIILSEQSRTPWYYSHFVNIMLKNPKQDCFPTIRLEDHLHVYSDILHEKRLAYESQDIIKEIKEQIVNNKYVIMYFNWKYINLSNYYNKTDMVHEALIYGFNNELQCFYLLAFEVNSKMYTSIKISYEECRRQFAIILNEELVNSRWFTYYGFPASTIGIRSSYDYELDKRAIFFALERSPIKGCASHPNGTALGYYVFESLAIYFEELALSERVLLPSEYPYWNIMMQKLADYNRLMMNRIQYLKGDYESKLLNVVHDAYQKELRYLTEIRLKSLAFQRVGTKQALKEISKLYNNIYQVEKRAVPILMEYLVSH